MPEVAHRLLRSFDDESLSLNVLADLIAQDQGLSVKLLRMANSARYSPRRTIATINDAAASIGLQSLRDLAMAACVAGAFPKTGHFDRPRFWRHCMATAGHARVLADVCDLDPDAAYLAGLVTRTGELLMLMTQPEGVAQAELRAVAPDSLLEQELAVLGCTHLDVTGELARRWSFPATLVAGFSAALDPMATRPFSRLGAALRLASVMSDAGERALPVVATLLELQPELVRHLNLDVEWLTQHTVSWDRLTAGVDQLVH
jgi:HD-like signal output (HDOD) protein